MPAQVKKLAGTATYELRAWAHQVSQKPRGASFWPGMSEESPEVYLRLPSNF